MTLPVLHSPAGLRNFSKMCAEYRQKKQDHTLPDHESKPTFLDRVFGLLEGPIATTMVKLLATSIVCASTIALTGIIAMASFSLSAMLATMGLGMLTTGIIWIFGGWKRSSQPDSQKLEALKAKITELEERLQNVEVIERFENRLAGQVSREQAKIREQEEETRYKTSAMENEGQLF